MRSPAARRLCALVFGAMLATCAEPSAQLYEERLFAMATWVDVAFEARDREAASTAMSEVQALLRRSERDLYAWAQDGELARVNAALARGEHASLSPELAGLLTRARELSAESGGFFDPGVGALVKLWGFDSMLDPPHEPPPAAAIATLLERGASIAALDIEGLTAVGKSDGLVIDLGGIAKGYVVDRALELLARHGIHDALVNAGGDLRVAGTRDGRAWRVGVKDPRHPGVLVTLELADGEAAFTSGDYERYFESGGRRWHHLLDPSTGRPAEHTASVTVIADDGVTADAAATAVFVAGRDRWRDVAAALGVSLVLRVDADGSVETTPAMAARLNSSARTGSDIIGPAPVE
jgi:FAD:protein FMN transferase